MAEFYVYEHWRPDTDLPFYVGKGKGDRAYRFQRRTRYHKNVVAKLARNGLRPDVRIVASGLTERQAFDVEIERISHWRTKGARLTNLTHGGDGSAGYRHTLATRAKMKKTPAQIEVLRARQTGKLVSNETREKIRAIRTGSQQTEETKAKLAAIFKDRKFTPEWRAKISAGLMGRIVSVETKALWSSQRRGRKTGPPSAETRQKISAKLKGHEVSDETRAKIAEKARSRAAAEMQEPSHG